MWARAWPVAAILLAGAVPLLIAGAAWAQAQEEPAPPPVIGTATLPRDLTPWGMYLNADPVVKAVLIGLAFASIVTWTVWLAKTIELDGGQAAGAAGAGGARGRTLDGRERRAHQPTPRARSANSSARR